MKSRELLSDWERYKRQIRSATPVDLSESAPARRARIDRLNKDWQGWLRYYLPNLFPAPFAPFQIRYAEAVLSGDYTVITREFARDHGKTTLAQGLVMYMAMQRMFRTCLWVSKSGDAATEMLTAVKVHLEHNQRIISDYGIQKSFGGWLDDRFVTRMGISFRALGRGQSPRGTKNDAYRPDLIICDDLDDDELVRSPEQLQKAWEWMMSALFASFSVGGKKRFIVLNNRIAEDSLMGRIIPVSDNHERINLLDETGQPTWSERFSLAECQEMIDKLGTHLAQKEYFNNPVIPGSVFKRDWVQYVPMPPLSQYRYLVAYLDPSFSAKKHADHKAWILVGLWKKQYHIIKAFCGVATIEEMVHWGYEIEGYCRSQGAVVELWMEEVFMQQYLYKDFAEVGSRKGYLLPVRGDKRKKPDKDARISALSGEFERGNILLNEGQKASIHLRNLEEQLLLFQMGNTRIRKDGPDALEGAIYKLKEKIISAEPMKHGNHQPHAKRW